MLNPEAILKRTETKSTQLGLLPRSHYEPCSTSLMEIEDQLCRHLWRRRKAFKSFRKQHGKLNKLNACHRRAWYNLQENTEEFTAWLPAEVAKRLLSHDDFRKSLSMRFRLAAEETPSKYSRNMREAIEAAGGWEHYRYVPLDTDEIVRLLSNPRWVPEWPDTKTPIRRAQQVCFELKREGSVDFTPTVDSVKTIMMDIVKKAQKGM